MKNERGARLPSNCHKQLTSSQWSCGWQLKLKQNNFWTVCGRTGLLENSRISWEGFAFTRPFVSLAPCAGGGLGQACLGEKHFQPSLEQTYQRRLIRGGCSAGDGCDESCRHFEAAEGARSSSASSPGGNLWEVSFSSRQLGQSQWGADQMSQPCRTSHSQSINHGFLLLEDVEAAFGTRKQMIESLSVDTLGEPLLSAAGSRMSRQQEQISSLSAYSRKLVWKTSRVHRPLTLFSKPRKSKSHICCSWRKHWKVLSRAMQLPSFQMSWPFAHRNAVLCVAATKHSLAKGRRKDIKAIWDALDWRIGVYKSVGEDELALYVLKSSFGTWRKLKRILDITPEEFNAALLEFWSSHSWPPMSDTVFSDTHNISKWCNISRYFLSVKLVTNVHNFLQNLL